MKNLIRNNILSLIIFSILFIGVGTVYATITTSGNFPTVVNYFQDGDIINSGDWNNIESTIGNRATTSTQTIFGKLNDIMSTTSMKQLNTLDNLTRVGVIVSGTWNAGVIPVAYGGTGVTSPSLVAGTNITISGTWPNQTINASGGGGGGAGGTFSTSTISGYSGVLTNYPNNTTDVVVIGATGTSTAKAFFDPNGTEFYRIGSSNTASTTIMGLPKFPTIGQGFYYGGSGGALNAIASSSIKLSWFNNDANFTVFPFTSVAGYNSTSTVLALLGGFFSTASTTLSGNTYHPNLAQGFSFIGSNGLVSSVASSSINISGFNNDSGYVQNTRTLTVAGTANQITSSAGAQDLSANRTWTLSFPNQIIFPQYASSTNGFSTPYASSTNLFAGSATLGTFSGILKGTSGAVGLASNGTDYTLITGTTCSGTDKVSAISASGAVTCSTDTGGNGTGLSTSSPISNSNVLVYTSVGAGSAYGVATSTPTVGSSLSYSGTLGSFVGGSTGAFSINLANPNTWTGLQTFTNSSTTLGSFSYASSTLYYGANLTTCDPTTGKITWSGGQFGCGTDQSGGGGGSDPFTHPATGQSATTSLMLLNGQASTTMLSAGSAYFGGTATTTISSIGSITMPLSSIFILGTTTPGILRTNASGVVYASSATSTPINLFNSFTNPDATCSSTACSTIQSAIINSPASYFNTSVYVASSTSAKTGFKGLISVPHNFASSTAQVAITWTATSTATGNVVFDFDWRCVGGDNTTSLYGTTFQGSTTTTVANPTGGLRKYTLMNVNAGYYCSAGDTMQFYLARDGADGADTGNVDTEIYNATISFLTQ